MKQQLADASSWDTQQAVAAVTAASAGAAGARGFDEEELDELREKVSELEAENKRLQAMVSPAQVSHCGGGSAMLLRGSRGVSRRCKGGNTGGCALCVRCVGRRAHCTRQDSGSPRPFLSCQPAHVHAQCARLVSSSGQRPQNASQLSALPGPLAATRATAPQLLAGLPHGVLPLPLVSRSAQPLDAPRRLAHTRVRNILRLGALAAGALRG